MHSERIGFIGAGLMGHGMAANLQKAGHEVTVIAHRNRVPIDDLVSRGASEAGELAELAGRSDCIVLCVSNSQVVEAVTSQLLAHLRPDHVLVDTSTSDPTSTRQVAERVAGTGAAFADAPLTGGAEQAAQGVLGAMVGAEPDVFARIEPVLAAFCSRIAHFGPVGSGHSAKLINNYLVMAMVAAITDTFRVARRCGIDWGQLFEVMKCGSNYSEALRRIVEPALEGDFDGYQFTVDNALKDISYYVSFAEQRLLVSGMARQTREFFADAAAQGHGDLMLSRLIDPDTGDRHDEIE